MDARKTSDLGNKEILARNLQNYLDLAHKTRNDLAKDLGFKYTTVSNWLQAERYPRIDKIEMMAKYLGIDKSDLIERPSKPKSAAGIRIPILGSVVAGVPIEAIEDVLGYEEISEKLAHDGTFFALKVKGASMYPKICEDDIVIIREQPDVESGQIAVVLINGNEATVKAVRKQVDGITLIGYNVDVYQPHFYSNQEIESLPVKVIGRVVELHRSF